MKTDQYLSELFDAKADGHLVIYDRDLIDVGEQAMSKEAFLRLARQLITEVEQPDKLQDFMNDVHNWADNTFGKERTALAPLHHLQKEVQEAINAMQDEDHLLDSEKRRHTIEELADCFILILNASSKYGLTFDDLFISSVNKMTKNKTRKWGKPDANGVVQHLKEQPDKATVNYSHVVEQSDKEKFQMYDKLDKAEIINMLIQCNKHLENLTPMVSYTIKPDPNDPFCPYCGCPKRMLGNGIVGQLCICTDWNQAVKEPVKVTFICEHNLSLSGNGYVYCSKCHQSFKITTEIISEPAPDIDTAENLESIIKNNGVQSEKEIPEDKLKDEIKTYHTWLYKRFYVGYNNDNIINDYLNERKEQK